MVEMLRKEHFNEQEIEALMSASIPPLDWRQASLDYRLSHRLHKWSCTQIEDAVIRWAKENGTWPLHRDFVYANRLPSPNVVAYHNRNFHWCKTKVEGGRKTLYARIASRAQDLTADLVLRIPNQTFRRDAIVSYGGFAAIVQAGGGRRQQQDDFGTLWRLDYAEENVDDFSSLFVEVVNSTPQLDKRGKVVLGPDGEPVFDHYFLRVPPNMRTAKEAVAWTGHFERRMGTKLLTLDGESGGLEFVNIAAQS
jgi:hypothetical protein